MSILKVSKGGTETQVLAAKVAELVEYKSMPMDIRVKSSTIRDFTQTSVTYRPPLGAKVSDLKRHVREAACLNNKEVHPNLFEHWQVVYQVVRQGKKVKQKRPVQEVVTLRHLEQEAIMIKAKHPSSEVSLEVDYKPTIFVQLGEVTEMVEIPWLTYSAQELFSELVERHPELKEEDESSGTPFLQLYFRDGVVPLTDWLVKEKYACYTRFVAGWFGRPLPSHNAYKALKALEQQQLQPMTELEKEQFESIGFDLGGGRPSPSPSPSPQIQQPLGFFGDEEKDRATTERLQVLFKLATRKGLKVEKCLHLNSKESKGPDDILELKPLDNIWLANRSGLGLAQEAYVIIQQYLKDRLPTHLAPIVRPPIGSTRYLDSGDLTGTGSVSTGQWATGYHDIIANEYAGFLCVGERFRYVAPPVGDIRFREWSILSDLGRRYPRTGIDNVTGQLKFLEPLESAQTSLLRRNRIVAHEAQKQMETRVWDEIRRVKGRILAFDYETVCLLLERLLRTNKESCLEDDNGGGVGGGSNSRSLAGISIVPVYYHPGMSHSFSESFWHRLTDSIRNEDVSTMMSSLLCRSSSDTEGKGEKKDIQELWILAPHSKFHVDPLRWVISVRSGTTVGEIIEAWKRTKYYKYFGYGRKVQGLRMTSEAVKDDILLPDETDLIVLKDNALLLRFDTQFPAGFPDHLATEISRAPLPILARSKCTSSSGSSSSTRTTEEEGEEEVSIGVFVQPSSIYPNLSVNTANSMFASEYKEGIHLSFQTKVKGRLTGHDLHLLVLQSPYFRTYGHGRGMLFMLKSTISSSKDGYLGLEDDLLAIDLNEYSGLEIQFLSPFGDISIIGDRHNSKDFCPTTGAVSCLVPLKQSLIETKWTRTVLVSFGRYETVEEVIKKINTSFEVVQHGYKIEPWYLVNSDQPFHMFPAKGRFLDYFNPLTTCLRTPEQTMLWISNNVTPRNTTTNRNSSGSSSSSNSKPSTNTKKLPTKR